jgi:uncharacterized protein
MPGQIPRSAPAVMEVRDRVAHVEWGAVERDLDAQGWATLPPLVEPAEAEAFIALYDDDDAFRSRVVMARHGFGQGEYRYFRYPLPGIVAELRACLYERLQPIACRWRAAAGQAPLPLGHDDFIADCHAAGQRRPTPLLLRYGPGDHNCLHQDLYGERSFPLQVVLLLSDRSDFTGGELVLTEQRPRMQSRASVVPLQPLGGAVFAVNRRPVRGTRGTYHVAMRHGVSKVTSGWRHTLGIIFHDAT